MLATEFVVTGTNMGIYIIEAQSAAPGVKITQMAYGGGPPAAPDLSNVRFLGVQQPDNRVVAMGRAKDKDHEARVYFSDPSDYTTWNVDNYVDLDPGDGEFFTGTASFRGQLWIFKETKAFIFYGNSTDAAGGVIFNYRTVDLGTRVSRRNVVGDISYGPAIATGLDGIYFVGVDGIYFTESREAVEISRPINALLWGTWDSIETTLGASADTIQAGLYYGERRLYVNTGRLIYVYDSEYREWMIWQTPTTTTATTSGATAYWVGRTSRGNSRPAITLSGHSIDDKLWALGGASSLGTSTEDGKVIPAFYRSGFYDFDSDYRDRIEQTRIWGTGTVTCEITKDFEQSGSSEVLSFGGTDYLDIPVEQVARISTSGQLFSHKLSGDAPWAVHRLTQAISSQESPGSK